MKKIAIIGYGGQGAWHAEHAMHSDVVSLAGVYDISGARCDAARERGIRVYSSREELLSDPEVNIVVCATPNDSHKEIVISALRAGKHVICEKPVALSVTDFDDMCREAAAAGRLLTVHQNRRWDVDYLAIQSLLHTGEIGEAVNIESRIHGSRGIPSDWRCKAEHGGGMIYDWGVHLIDQILQLIPEKVTHIYCEMTHITEKEVAHGYKHVHTPDLGSVELYKTSGHWDHYKDDMFPAMELDEESYVLRPMNCPHHMVIYGNKLHSYRDLPIRIAEIANDFRYEAAGAVKGIERARSFTQNDSHIFCTKDQIEEEFKGVLDLIIEVYKDFNIDITKHKFRLSLRDKDNKEKYFDDDNMWDTAEGALRKVLTDLKVDFIEAKGEAAFYGPKLDILIKPAVGNEVAIPTIQLDFLLPKRFNLTYINEKGEKETPVVIHRAILGSLDRFIAFLLEETKGNLPLWLAPVGVEIIPVSSEHHLEYAEKVYNALLKANIRVELDSRNEKLGYRLREAQTRKINYNVILGDNEVENETISYRLFGQKETTTVSCQEFISMLKEIIEAKK